MEKPKTLEQLRADQERVETQLAQEQHKLERLDEHGHGANDNAPCPCLFLYIETRVSTLLKFNIVMSGSFYFKIPFNTFSY